MISTATAQWQQRDREHHLHPFTDARALAEKGVNVITRADGVYLWNSEGKRFLDGMAGLWCVQVGYGRHELAAVARRQLEELPYYNTFFQSATPPAIDLAAKLGDLTPAGLGHVFFANSGSEANDTAAKMVRAYWNLMGRPEKKTIISRHYAYHGVTMAAASLSGLTPMHTLFDLPLPGFVHVAAPYWYREGGEMSPDEFGVQAARAVEEKILELGPDKVGAFIGEPVMGAGGVIVPPATYWPEIQRICRAHDVLLIADEVICGFGRTGPWFGCDTYGIAPDMMTIAKGLSSGYLPISGVMLHDRVAEVLIDKAGEFAHGFTYSGHLVCCAVALENLRILEEEGIVARAGAETAPYFQARLGELTDHPLVGEVRGVGMVAAIELVADKAARRPFDESRKVGTTCRDLCLENGLVMRAVRDVMVLSPPLVISRDEIDDLVALARRALDATAAAVAAG